MKTQLQHQHHIHPIARIGIGCLVVFAVFFSLTDMAGAQCTDIQAYTFPKANGTGISAAARQGWDGGRVFAVGQAVSTRNSLRLRYTATYGNERTAGITYDFGSLSVAKITMTYRSDFPSTQDAFTVSCGKNQAQAKVVATLKGSKVGKKVTWVTREVTLTPAACGVNNDLGKLYVQLQNIATGTLNRYQDFDTIRFLSCPSIAFADPITKDPIAALSVNAGDTAEVLACLTDVSIAPSANVPVTLSKSMSSVTLSTTSLTIPANNTCTSSTVTLTRGTTNPTETGTITATTTAYSSATLVVEPGIVFKDSSTGSVLTSLDIDENGGNKTVKVCLPSAPTTATTVTLTPSATDSRININTSVIIQAGQTCENLTISVSNNSQVDGTDNTNGDTIDLDASGGGYEGTLPISITDDEAAGGVCTKGAWDWTIIEPVIYEPGAKIASKIITNSCNQWNVEKGSFSATCSDKTCCKGTSQDMFSDVTYGSAFLPDGSHSTGVLNPVPAEVDFNIVFGTNPAIVANEIGKRLCICVKSEADSNPETNIKCRPVLVRVPINNVYHPTFFMTASYDWMHNFYDNNIENQNTYTDSDTDNFNRIIMTDSNLFPIYSALNGDQDFPNIFMRNWSSAYTSPYGGSGTSPSINDYMNRSVAAVANFIPYTSYIYYGYGAKSGTKAVGLRTYMEWVYAVDPANNNIRRYKFMKIADDVPPTLFYDPVEAGDARDQTGDSCTITNNNGECSCCKEDKWAILTAAQTSCTGTYTNSNGVSTTTKPEDLFITYYKQQDGGVTFPQANCTATTTPLNPGFKVKLSIPARDINKASTIDVPFSIEGVAHDNSGTIMFVINPGAPGSTNGACTKNSPEYDRGSNFDCPTLKTQSYTFPNVPTSCADCFGEYCQMTVGIYECKNHGNWAFRLPGTYPPDLQDNGYRIPVEMMDTNPTAWAAMSPAQKTATMERRWTKIDRYLDTVPPRSYPGYTAFNSGKWAPGYGSTSNKTFNDASNVRFKDPRDIAAYRDYFDIKNGAPTYIFVADTGNSRIQVFMNATGVAGDVKARAPIRPVRVKGPNAAKADTNEIGFRAFPNMTGGNGRRGDWRNYTTFSGASFQPYTAGKGEFYFPHGVAVDQDPDSRDVYLFVADTYNHRIQVFRDISGVSSQDIKTKNFDFKLAAMWGTYPLQTSIRVMAQPGPYNFRYPKGVALARFKNNSSFLYVVDSKNYRVMRYLIGESPATLNASRKVTNSGTGITTVQADAGFGYDAVKGTFSRRLASVMGKPMMQHSLEPGFQNPQDVATGYSGFYLYTAPFGRGVEFLNNYMVYVTDSSRNETSINPRRVSMRVMQFIDVPEGFSSITGAWIPWETTRNAKFSTYTAARMKEGTAAIKYHNLKLGQNPFGLKGPNAFQLYSGGVYQSKANYTGSGTSVAVDDLAGMTNNAGQAGYFTDRPFGIAALQWNTLKPIDVRVVDWSDPSESADYTAKSFRDGEKISRTLPLRIGVASRYQNFGKPLNKRAGFKNSSTVPNLIAGAWDAQFAGRVHIFCYDQAGKFTNYTALYPQMAARRFSPNNDVYRPSYLLPSGLAGIPGTNGCPSKGLVKVVAEDKDFPYSGRTGTVFYGIQ
ncbi:predicted solute binding protein [Candidatus Moduliflexus flocculans]|uniref:Predicted solute binding protein n=1 Tax=Candidatus Moduliflexus flocculans TaxID=1499966 RepID=A0A0S6W5P4_9BACT|nr:predicted solute binding protein [Candidatus Moduliflexus flocculans]